MSEIFPAKSALIALSGGVDSAVLLAKAKEAGVVLHAATVISEFTPNVEIKAAEELAARFDVPWHPICLGLLVFEEIRENPPERCYLCKKIIMREMKKLARLLGMEAVFDGTHVDDLTKARPGIRALEEEGIISPFALAGIGKAEIISEAKRLGINAAPPSACLATRIPFGTTLTEELLEKVDAAECILRDGGVEGILRVRICGTQAVVETETQARQTAKIYENKLKQLGIEEVSYRDYSAGV